MTRHELKEQLQHDRFTDTVSEVVTYASSHRQELIRWVIIGVVVAVLAGGAFWYMSYTNSVRDQDLANAFTLADRPVGPAGPGVTTFPTQAAKDAALMKAFSSVASKDPGSKQGLTAEYYVGTLKAKTGDVKGAEAALSPVADSNIQVASLAKIALAELYAGDNKMSQATSLLRSLIDKPSDLVSKAQAEILLARIEEKTNPKQAQKLLTTVQTQSKDPTVDRVAQQVAAQMSK